MSKPGLHPRNRHRAGYDFAALCRASPALAGFVAPNAAGAPSIDFADPAAVRALNFALLKQAYGLEHWDIAPEFLCPPVPGRADYIHRVADLLTEDAAAPPRGAGVRVLDIGVGANCIYPIIGRGEYGWSFVGSDVDASGLACAGRIVASNHQLVGVELRLQPSPTNIFRGVVRPGETFAACVCNPPFHASAAEADEAARRKWRGLGRDIPGRTTPSNFGGHDAELWCEGGEGLFARRLIDESVEFRERIGWFTILISKESTLPGVERALKRAGAAARRVLPLAAGRKRGRIVAWTFLDDRARRRLG